MIAKFVFINKLIREEDSDFNTNIIVENFQGWPVTAKSLPTTNFDFNFKFRDSIKQGLEFWSENSLIKFLSPLNIELSAWDTSNSSERGKASFTSLNSLKFPIEQCYNESYVCVNVTTSLNTDFIEWDNSNNELCIDVMPNVYCRPNVDISISNIVLISDEPLFRNIKQNHNFKVSLSNDNSNKHDVIELFDNYYNYDMEYAISNQTIDINNTEITWKETNLNLKEKQKGIKVGNTLDFSINNVLTDLTREECEDNVFVCFRIVLSNSSSYSEINRVNDLSCFDFNPKKNCTPGNF